MVEDETVLLKNIQDCQLADLKGKTWGLCFQVTTKDLRCAGCEPGLAITWLIEPHKSAPEKCAVPRS